MPLPRHGIADLVDFLASRLCSSNPCNLPISGAADVSSMCAGLEPFHHTYVLAALKRPLMQQVVQLLGSLASVDRVSSGFLGSTLAGLGHSGHL